MERLTEKNNGNTPYNQTEYPYLAGADINNITNKLGKLEDIEEELGIPLEVLFNALKDGIYRFYEEFEDEPPYIYYTEIDVVCCEEDKWLFVCGNDIYYLKDYGKTWALTREELEQ